MSTSVAVTTATYGTPVLATATDASGNVFVAGAYPDPVAPLGLPLPPGNPTDQIMFVGKWSPASNRFVWGMEGRGLVPRALAVSGNRVYVAGRATNDPVHLGSIALAANTNETGVLVQLTDNGSSGSVGWAQLLGGRSYDASGLMGLAVSGSSVYVTGSFVSNTASFGPYTLSSSSTAPLTQRPEELYVARLLDNSATPTVAWVQQAPAGSTTVHGRPYGLAVSGSSVYLTGWNTSAFVAKFTDTGAYQWSTAFGGPQTVPASIAAQGSQVYVAGRFRDATASFGATTLAQPAGATAFSSDLFVTKLTDTGASATQNWALQAGGVQTDSATAVIAGTTGVYVAGSFAGAASFGATTLSSAGSSDVVVTRVIETSGSAAFVWARSAGGTAADGARGLARTGTSLYVVGQIAGPATFAPLALGAATVGYTGFLARLTDVALPTRATVDLPGLVLYPNPAPGTATLRVPAGPATVEVLDALGRRVQQATVAAGQDYPLAGLAPGVYAVRVRVGESEAVRRLIVE